MINKVKRIRSVYFGYLNKYYIWYTITNKNPYFLKYSFDFILTKYDAAYDNEITRLGIVVSSICTNNKIKYYKGRYMYLQDIKIFI